MSSHLTSTNSAATSSSRSTLGHASSGTSPGRTLEVHLIGPGCVGRAFLRRLDAHALRLVAVSDSSGTLAERSGLDANALGRIKEERRSLASTGLAEDLPLDLLVELVPVDVLVDATSSRFEDARDAVERSERALRSGTRVVFASKDALAARAHAWVDAIRRGRVGWNAALGGTGLRLARDLDALAPRTQALELVANATSSCVLGELARGASFDAALARAREAGLCEGDAAADLDGRDAASKLAIVAGAFFGRALRLEAIERCDLREVDPERVRWHAQRGQATRLVARATREGAASVRAEELPRGSILAVPHDRVAYGLELDDGRTRVHLGQGLGPARTAEALLADVLAGAPSGGAA